MGYIILFLMSLVILTGAISIIGDGILPPRIISIEWTSTGTTMDNDRFIRLTKRCSEGPFQAWMDHWNFNNLTGPSPPAKFIAYSKFLTIYTTFNHDAGIVWHSSTPPQDGTQILTYSGNDIYTVTKWDSVTNSYFIDGEISGVVLLDSGVPTYWTELPDF